LRYSRSRARFYESAALNPGSLINQNDEELMANETRNHPTNQDLLKANFFLDWHHYQSDQKKGVPCPPAQKPVPEDARLFELPPAERLSFGQDRSISAALANRKSRRQYKGEPISFEELAFLCWSVQGVREFYPEQKVTRRISPSAGARHPLETYIAVHRVTGLESGLYRYLPLDHQLCQLYIDEHMAERTARACTDFALPSACTFAWTALPYRTEWRYGSAAFKFIALDAGHVCQNMYLACEAIGAGTCAIGAYNQPAMDELLGVDGEEEFTVYAAPVGR
jgi:SagB-type dehydrogenase family enzyme